VEFEINRLRQQGGNVTQDQIRALEMRYGLNDPAHIRFVKWITGFVQGDYGESFQYRQPVKNLIGQRLIFTIGISIFLIVASMGNSRTNWSLFSYAPLYDTRLPDHRNAVFWSFNS
jgi:ABC-type dipeptide/oligopeptide/nickel transport system permease component